MPARLFIHKKRKSLGQDTWDEGMENGQKRRCLGSFDYTDGNKFSETYPSHQEIRWEDDMNDDNDVDFCNSRQIPMESNNNNYNLPNPLLNGNMEQSSPVSNGSDHQVSQKEEPSALMNGCEMEFDYSDEAITPAASTTSSTYYEQLNVILGPADRFCVGGTLIHRPGLNRSYCKPSWDAMTDMRPYVSDYY